MSGSDIFFPTSVIQLEQCESHVRLCSLVQCSCSHDKVNVSWKVYIYLVIQVPMEFIVDWSYSDLCLEVEVIEQC